MVSTMYTIGEFAAYGRVSARMLRHYDAIGLLVPAQVDPHSGYRRYSAAQVPVLLRIVELRELGIGLDEIGAVLAAGEGDALRGALMLRRAELEASVVADIARLQRIDRRLSLLEGSTTMNETVQYRPVPAVTVYAVSAVAPGMGPENVSPVVGRVIPQLDAALAAAGRPAIEPGVFWYEATDDGDALSVNVSYVAEDEPVPGEGYEVVTLPAVATMATLIHRGDMSGIGDSWSTLMERVSEDGYRMTGATREVYLEADGHEPGPDWVTELQIPVEKM